MSKFFLNNSWSNTFFSNYYIVNNIILNFIKIILFEWIFLLTIGKIQEYKIKIEYCENRLFV